jgi:signal transduction histidine kinase
MQGLRRRLSLILAGSLILVALVWLAATRMQQNLDAGDNLRLPLPEQAAAIVSLIESTPPAELPMVLKAINSSSIVVTVDDRHPEIRPDQLRMPALTWATRRYVENLGGRSVEASTSAQGLGRDQPIRLVIGLNDGRFVSIEARAGVLKYQLGMRLAIATLVVLALIGGLSLWLLGRQLQPLEKVVAAVDHFGERLDTPELAEDGVPEVRRLVIAFNGMRSRIRTLIDGRTRMLAAISHDLGTYLTRLRLRVEYIEDEEQRHRAVADIEAMQSLMDDSLALGRLQQESGQMELVDLADLSVQQVVANEDARIRIAALEAAAVIGQRKALARAVQNLLSNALKHAGDAELSVLAAGTGPQVELRVDDHGPGIPAGQRELVLEPFYRGDTARNLDVAGSGLGLSIVAEIVRRHGGQLALEDRPGGGLRVRVLLPRAPGN